MSLVAIRKFDAGGPGVKRCLLRLLSIVVTFGLLSLLLLPNAQASCSVGACVQAGPRLASVNTAQGALTNALLGNLLGTGASLNVLDWNSIAQTDVNAVRYLSALQTSLGVSSPATALTTNATAAQLINAAATAAQADGNTAAASALNGLGTQIGGLMGTVKLGDLITTGLPAGAFTTTQLNALDLVTGIVQLYNYRNVATTPSPITLSGSSLGLGSVINSVQLYAQVIEPSVYVCGPTGNTFHTAAIRVKLDLNLVSLTPNVGLLNALVGVSGANVSIGQLGIYLDVARADGSIGLINAVSNAVSVQVTPGVADVYLGNIPDATFFNRTRPLNPATDLAYGNIGTVTINTLTVGLLARSYARGQAPFASVLNFTGPYPQQLTASTSVSFLNNLTTALITNLDVALSPTLGLLNAVVLPVVKTIVSVALSPVLGSLLSTLVDPLLTLIGVKLGQVDVVVSGVALSCSISGTVYADNNHNANFDGTESGCGLTLYAKLILNTQATGPIIQSVAIDPVTGRYTLAGVGSGTYSIIIDNNTTATDVTPTVPTGWLGTSFPDLTRSPVTVSNNDISAQDLGLFQGAKLSGTVFKDQGTSGGIANDGIKQTSETGLSGATLRLTDATGATVYDSTQTLGTGTYTVWIPASAGAGTLKLTENNSPGFVSTGGGTGTTTGTYSRATDTLSFTAVAGTLYTSVDFADVPDNRFGANTLQIALPGTVVFHPHVFNAQSTGQVTLSSTATVNPPAGLAAWQQVLYLDTNCNGVLDSGELAYSAPLNVSVDQTVCLLVKVTVPANTPYGAQYSAQLNASYSYLNASPALTTLYTVAELTTVARASDAALKLAKTVNKVTAKSGDSITYTLTYRNDSTQPLNNLKINDNTPRFTRFSSAACGTLAGGLSICTLSVQPGIGASGALEWTFTGALLPGATGNVLFSVVVE